MKRSNVIALFIMFAAVSVFIVVMAFLGGNPKKSIAAPTATGRVVVLPTPVSTDEQGPVVTAAPTELPTGAVTEQPTEEPTATAIVRPVINPSDFSDFSTKVVSWGITGNWADPNDRESVKFDIDSAALSAAEDSDYIYLGTNGPEKTIYLTFNIAYEDSSNSTTKILDILNASGVKATFFLSKNYFESYGDIVRAIIESGHTVGSRGDINAKSGSKRGMVNLGTGEFADTMWEIEKLYQAIAGENTRMQFYRPEEFSARDMALAGALGYTVIFRSFDYRDWDDYYSRDKALQKLKDNTTSGAIFALSSSKYNVEILDDYIVWAKDQGYRFAAIDEAVSG